MTEMTDSFKNKSDKILKNIFANLTVNGEDTAGARDLLINILTKAGKGKDEFVQVLGREIGLALAAVLAKPLEQITETKRVRITVELVPKASKKKKNRSSRTTKA
jgi:hypothetical protein